MKENLKLLRGANLVDEAILILYQWANKDALEQIKEEYRGLYPEDQKRYDRIWDILLDIYYTVKEELKPKKDRIDYYFKSQNNNYFFLASFAFLWDFHCTENKLISYEERFGKLTEEEILKAYAQVISIDEADVMAADEVQTYDDFISFLDASSCSREMKWDILKIFHQQKEAYEEVATLIRETVNLIERQFGRQIAELEQGFYDYWSGLQEKEDILALVQRNLKVTWEVNEKGTILLPMLFQPISVTLAVHTDTKIYDILHIGIILDQRLITNARRMGPEDIVNIGKLLCDKSKVDILKMTAEKPCYGKEIAAELGLSTATISYHVNALMKLGLLQAELSSNRVYYSINQEKLTEYLEDIRKYFTKEIR